MNKKNGIVRLAVASIFLLLSLVAASATYSAAVEEGGECSYCIGSTCGSGSIGNAWCIVQGGECTPGGDDCFDPQ